MFAPELHALFDPKPVLLVDDDQGKILKRNFLLYDGVSADND